MLCWCSPFARFLAHSITTTNGQAYQGNVDGLLAPFGMYKQSAGRQAARILYEHKQSDRQKAEYKAQHNEKVCEQGDLCQGMHSGLQHCLSVSQPSVC